MFLKSLDIVSDLVNEGYVVPLDVAVDLMTSGYDVSSLTKSLDGFSIDELIDLHEELFE